MNTGHLTVAWLPGGGYSVVDSEHNTVGHYTTAGIAAAHHALALEEIARLRDVVRSLRNQSRNIVLDRNRLLAGFAWTAKVQDAAEEAWNAETERLVNGGGVKESLTTGDASTRELILMKS